MLEWGGRPAAFNIGLVRGERHMSWLVSRDPSIQAYSPGKLLDAHVIGRAIDAGASVFDFGLGEEEYKLSHASGATEVATWGLYP
jgi:CelD/BcsL family acetyltransferase involved in cellulose biosynthesis